MNKWYIRDNMVTTKENAGEVEGKDWIGYPEQILVQVKHKGRWVWIDLNDLQSFYEKVNGE